MAVSDVSVVSKGEIPGSMPVEVSTVGKGLSRPSGLSPSSVSTFESCPLSFYFSRVAKIPSPATVDTLVGDFVHAVLEQLMSLPCEQRTLDRARLIASGLRAEFRDNPDFVSLDLDDEAERVWVWRCWNSIVSYFRLEDPSQVTVDSVEQQWTAEVHGVPLRGVSDRVDVTSGGGRVVCDYKTGSTPTEGWGNRRLRQLALYGVLIEAVTGVRVERLDLLFINDTDPCRIVGRFTGTIEAEVVEMLTSTWQAVRESMSSGLFEATPSVLCAWCAYQSFCPAWGGNLADAPHPAVANVQVRLAL